MALYVKKMCYMQFGMIELNKPWILLLNSTASIMAVGYSLYLHVF